MFSRKNKSTSPGGGGGGSVPIPIFLLLVIVTNWGIYHLYAPQPKNNNKSSRSSSSNQELTTAATTPAMVNSMAYQHSYGFFHDIPDDEWQTFFRTPTLQAQHYEHPDQPDRPANTGNVNWWRFMSWNPYFKCPHQKRIGGLGEGPKYVCDPERLIRQAAERSRSAAAATSSSNTAHCLVYSIGSGNGNYRFVDGLYEFFQKEKSGQFCEVHVFDPAPGNAYDRPTDNARKHITYHPWGLASSYSVEYHPQAVSGVEFLTFAEIRRRLGHEQRTIDILNMDCEGCEWHTMKDWLTPTADVRQLLLQTHNFPQSPSKYFDAILKHGFVLFSKEINTYEQNTKITDWSFIRMREEYFCEVSSPTVIDNGQQQHQQQQQQQSKVCVKDARNKLQPSPW